MYGKILFKGQNMVSLTTSHIGVAKKQARRGSLSLWERVRERVAAFRIGKNPHPDFKEIFFLSAENFSNLGKKISKKSTLSQRERGLRSTFIILPFLLTACASQLAELESVGKPPPISKLETPMDKKGYEPVHWRQDDELQERSYSNSLWQPGASSFFKDKKARRVGDILTVVVKIKDKAELKNETKRSRDTSDSAAAPKIFGMEEKIVGMLPGIADPSNLLSVEGSTTANGKGETKRQETLETNVAAMVTQILPNGNLVVHGSQEIRVNFELRQVAVDGIVRPEDISAANSVDSDQIAEARISYGGRGQLTNMQQPRIGSQVIDILSPF